MPGNSGRFSGRKIAKFASKIASELVTKYWLCNQICEAFDIPNRVRNNVQKSDAFADVIPAEKLGALYRTAGGAISVTINTDSGSNNLPPLWLSCC